MAASSPYLDNRGRRQEDREKYWDKEMGDMRE
jgi:hypothetical protein